MNGLGRMAVPAASLLLAAAGVWFGATVWGAVRTDVTPLEGSSMGRPSVAPGDPMRVAEAVPPDSGETRILQTAEGVYPQVSQDEILQAVNEDLFQPDRLPPMERYRLPAERPDLGIASGNDRRRREPNLRIVGTAIAGDRGIALVQLEDSIPFAVWVGEEVDGYTLASVREDSVTLVGPEDEFVFPVVEADLRRSSDTRGRNSRGNNAREEDLNRALQERVQQMLQQMGRGQMNRGGVVGPGIAVPLDPARLEELRQSGQLPPNVVIRTRPGGGGGGTMP